MEQDRIHIKLARRTPEERQADETRRLDPFMRALKACLLYTSRCV